MKSTPPIRVVAGVIWDPETGKILIARRPEDTHLGGFWEFPGGKVDGDESLEEALIREVREEVGLCIRVGKLILDEVHEYSDRRVHLHFFDCTILSRDVRREGDNILWCKPDDLTSYPMPKGNAAVVRGLQSNSD